MCSSRGSSQPRWTQRSNPSLVSTALAPGKRTSYVKCSPTCTGLHYFFCSSVLIESESVSPSVTSNCLWPHGLQTSRLLSPWNFPRKNIGVGCHSLLQGIFPVQGLRPVLLQCRQILYLWATREAHFREVLLYTANKWLVSTICQVISVASSVLEIINQKKKKSVPSIPRTLTVCLQLHLHTSVYR